MILKANELSLVTKFYPKKKLKHTIHYRLSFYIVLSHSGTELKIFHCAWNRVPKCPTFWDLCFVMRDKKKKKKLVIRMIALTNNNK